MCASVMVILSQQCREDFQIKKWPLEFSHFMSFLGKEDGHGRAGVHPGYHWARRRVLSGQVMTLHLSVKTLHTFSSSKIHSCMLHLSAAKKTGSSALSGNWCYFMVVNSSSLL